MRRKTRVHDGDGKSISKNKYGVAWQHNKKLGHSQGARQLHRREYATKPCRRDKQRWRDRFVSRDVAELALLSGVSSNVQTQLTDLGNDKEDEITGAATTVTSANLTSNRVLLSDGSGKISTSSVTTTTLAYLDATSSIQRPARRETPRDHDKRTIVTE